MPWTAEYLFCHDLPTRPMKLDGKVLVTGASGYIGGRLTPELIARGYRVRVMARSDAEGYRRRWPMAEVAVADALNYKQLKKALEGVEVAYYLIHSLGLGPRRFETADLHAAINFRLASQECGLKRIIYLGGLGEFTSCVSPHLQSRLQVAEELVRGDAQATIIRAAVIIGSGSASYEIIYHLVKKSPVLLIAPWAKNKCQPIGIRDVIKYLVGALETPDTASQYFDIGGKDILTYEEMLKAMAEMLDKNTRFYPSPISNIGVFAYFASLLTPVPAPVTRSLMEGLKDEVICLNNDIRGYIDFEPLSYREAIQRALARHNMDMVDTRWSDSIAPEHVQDPRLTELEQEPQYTAEYSIPSNKSAKALFDSICGIGGKTGWFNSNWMWRLRGMVDSIFMGVGANRGRRSASSLQINDVIDFWRVEDIREDERLLLRAEMLLPGRAWLEFKIKKHRHYRELQVKAHYSTHSFWGKLYWYLFLPFHHFIFKDLIEQIEARG